MDESEGIDKDLGTSRIWHELYIELLSNPMDKRSDGEFSKENGIHPNTLSYWKNRNRTAIFAEVQKRRRKYINEFRQMAYRSIGEKIAKDLDAAKLALQLTGDFVERSESRVEQMTDADKIRRIEALRKEAEEKLKARDESEKRA